MHPRPIFYLLATISYTKGKQKLKKEEWIVTKYETAREIMVNDSKTMDSLETASTDRTTRETRPS
jgi:DNA mismatch repair ATPase MutS